MREEKFVFIDTVGWVALLHRGDNLHQKAIESYRDIKNLYRITTDAVLVESCNTFSKSSMRPLALSLMEKVRESKSIGILEVVYVEEGLMQQGFELFKNRMDKEWSLTDCISFIVMKKKGINKAITSDKHFEQAGFEKLM
jgi:predicted nucleic acid-binding protein